MRVVTQNKAQAHFKELLDQVAAGQQITVTRGKRAIATLSPPNPSVTVASSVFDLEPVSVGKVFRPLTAEDDTLDEMLDI